MYMNSSFQIYFNKSIYFKLKLCNIDGVRILLILICKYNNYDKGDIYAKHEKKECNNITCTCSTIVILLLLAAIAIQMTLGENGLIAKSTQAQKEQAKAELYDTAKQSYTRLSLQAVENKMPKPDVEEVLTTEEFTAKYNVVGGNITDKKGTVIDTKEAVLDMLKTKYIAPTSELEEEVEEATPSTPTPTPTPEETTPQVVWPKVVAGVTIPEEDKDKMILKIRVPGTKAKIGFSNGYITKIKIDYGDGVVRNLSHEVKEFNGGEHVVKIWTGNLLFGVESMNERRL